ncbi:MAG: hypothetical protein RI571_11225 [Roseovarius sp.]|nr:hypothetical protein [Roseovarius sp.]
MTDETETQRRLVKARRNLTLGALAAAVAGGAAHAAPVMSKTADAPGWVQLASGEGEGEGEGASHGEGEGEGEGEGGSAALPSETGLMRDLGFMEGRLRAGMALYKAGDLDAARTHMGHPIEEKYGAVAAPLAERGYDRLTSEIEALAAAAEMAKAVETTSTVYGDLQGDGDYAMDSSVIYAAAARMELALAGWK